MSSINMKLLSGDKSHKVTVDLPVDAVACLSLGGSLDINGIILPLLKAEAEASFIEGVLVAKLGRCDQVKVEQMGREYSDRKYRGVK